MQDFLTMIQSAMAFLPQLVQAVEAVVDLKQQGVVQEVEAAAQVL
jgi:hypothetical protein